MTDLSVQLSEWLQDQDALMSQMLHFKERVAGSTVALRDMQLELLLEFSESQGDK